MTRCDCEHSDHFGQAIGGGAVLMPHPHPIGATAASVHELIIDHDRVTICDACRAAGHTTPTAQVGAGSTPVEDRAE